MREHDIRIAEVDERRIVIGLTHETTAEYADRVDHPIVIEVGASEFGERRAFARRERERTLEIMRR